MFCAQTPEVAEMHIERASFEVTVMISMLPQNLAKHPVPTDSRIERIQRYR